MELQALRYASMVSTMTFEEAVEIFCKYKQKNGYIDFSLEDAQFEIEGFVEMDIAEGGFAEDVKTILVSHNFSIELTTSVLWLNARNLDITCIKIQPYNDNGKILVDIQQIIPLPEAEHYQIKVKRKLEEKRETRKNNSKDYSKYQFNNMTLGKGRLALEMIKYHFEQHEDKPVKALIADFDSVTHSQPIIETLAIAKNNAQATGRARYFLSEDDILVANDGVQYVVSSQWGKDNIEDMIEIIEEKFGYQVEKIQSTGSAEGRKVNFENFEIIQLEDSTIIVKQNGISITAKPALRELCKRFNIILENSNGNLKNTRSLGNEVINAIEKKI
ncbi:hypothetical protein [Psychrobacter frigidicola]|uniref:hypothetical protein n=1 Tax=Psychrobacter frigidicola TaxID=45611 RepID=UPI00191B3797|nr:hypothetical protein [Psychrobacter frigidicola]